LAGDPYATLGVKKDTSQADIQKAYRRLAKKHHPDLNPGNSSAEEKFKEITAAYGSDTETVMPSGLRRCRGNGARGNCGGHRDRDQVLLHHRSPLVCAAMGRVPKWTLNPSQHKPRAGWVYFESAGDSQIGRFLIQHAGWEGGQHGWDELIRTTFVNAW
jgi:hypothetical protein